MISSSTREAHRAVDMNGRNLCTSQAPDRDPPCRRRGTSVTATSVVRHERKLACQANLIDDAGKIHSTQGTPAAQPGPRRWRPVALSAEARLVTRCPFQQSRPVSLRSRLTSDTKAPFVGVMMGVILTRFPRPGSSIHARDRCALACRGGLLAGTGVRVLPAGPCTSPSSTGVGTSREICCCLG